jgi:hypothetical protein
VHECLSGLAGFGPVYNDFVAGFHEHSGGCRCDSGNRSDPPYDKWGGTSILVISVYFGMILSVSRYGEVDQNTEEVKNKEV